MSFKYFILNPNGIDTIYRLNGKVHDRISLEAYDHGTWSDSVQLIKFFMAQVLTGWLDDDDALSYHEAITQLTKKVDEAKALALSYHGDQKYGSRGYIFHLEDVMKVLEEHAICADSEYNIDLHIVAWLHDVLEDTSIEPQLISDKFGQHILKSVQSLTDGKGRNRPERKAAMMEKLVLNQEGMIVKLADRISNIRISMMDNNFEKLTMYKNESDNFINRLEMEITTEKGKKLLETLKSS